MFSRFFIQRPIFAAVVSIVITLAGGITIPFLPVEQTPDITPPTVQVTGNYRGASATVVGETVATPIEEKVNGVEDMIYMSSVSGSDGSMNLTVSFEVGTDVDMATVLVQNRVATAEPLVPEEVRREGITTKKRSTNLVQMVNLISPDGQYDEIYISNYINTRIKDVLTRVSGVGDVTVFGAKDYGMRIWLDPDLLTARQLTTTDVVQAIREQNAQVAAGQIGAPPIEAGQTFQYTINTKGRLATVEEFEDLIVKTAADGRVVRVRDVARVELGAQAYNWYVELNGAPSIGLGIYQQPGANALTVAEGIRVAMQELKQDFPEGLEYEILYDATRAVEASIAEVIETLFVALLLVILTVYIFLQDFRTTLIPSITIPVSLLGTFGVMMGLGISINTLSLFGLVLAIGIVVDDAIVVVENTVRLIDSEKLSAKEAAAKAMEQVTGPVVATTLVLLAVFVPTAMLGGITGRLYQQFALTIATATIFSSINALTLSPSLCGLLLRPSPSRRGFLFTAFNQAFDASTRGYTSIIRVAVRRVVLAMIPFVGLLVLTGLGFVRLPTGFVPDEDQGYIFANITLPEGASLERTRHVIDEATEIIRAEPGVRGAIAIGGYTILDSVAVSNAGTLFVVLDPWEERPGSELHALGIARSLSRKLSSLREAVAFSFTPPPIQGLGSAGGFEFKLQDRGGVGLNLLEQVAEDIVQRGRAHPALTRMNNSFRTNVPQLFLDVDRTKAKRLGVPLTEVFGTLQAFLGSAYVNDFNIFGRTYRVMIQADSEFRAKVEDIRKIQVRNRHGEMLPLGTLLVVDDSVGPQSVFRHNLYPTATITGMAAPGYSSGQAIRAMQEIAASAIPPSMGYEWSGVTFQQNRTGNQAPFIFGLSLIFVFLVLAAQYESWGIPMAVLLSVPLALLGGLAATMVRALDNNVYTQIGFVLLIGLSSKSAILIVEFAKQLRSEGKSIGEAAIEAARLRFRAILMTAFSFILGVIPLVVASGAGAGSRQALGTAVFGGMLLATAAGVLFIPVLYVVVQSTTEWLGRLRGKAPEPEAIPDERPETSPDKSSPEESPEEPRS